MTPTDEICCASIEISLQTRNGAPSETQHTRESWATTNCWRKLAAEVRVLSIVHDRKVSIAQSH